MSLAGKLAAVGAATLLAVASPSPAGPMNLDNPKVKPGIEVLLNSEKYSKLLAGKSVGLITNPTGVDSRLNSTIDLLHEAPNIRLTKLFGPEHGVRGDVWAGDKVEDVTDPKTGVPVFSLYGKTRRPPPEYLEGLDVMVYDIQDVGSRSYTYIYTMAYAMEACGEAGIPFVVLDRPNPCGADYVSGNVLDEEQGTSFVGLYAIPYMYGLTPGETAMLFNDKYNKVKCDLTVVPMEGYERDMRQWDTGLPFVPSSPNIPNPRTAVYYSLTGIIGELDDVTIGAGYPLAFEVIAAPFIDRDRFVEELRREAIPGLLVMPISLKPYGGKFAGETVHGAHFFISNYDTIRPVEAQIHMMEVLQRLYPEKNLFADENKRRDMFDKVMGDKAIRHRILAGEPAEAIIASYQDDVKAWMEMAKPYQLYR